MLFACPVCPNFTDSPLGWLRFRARSAFEFDTVEWWQRDNLTFMSVAGVLVLLFVAFGVWQLWQWRSGRQSVSAEPVAAADPSRRAGSGR